MRNILSGIFIVLIGWLLLAQQTKKPTDFVLVSEQIPSLKIELRYHSTNNFIGDTIDGYSANKLFLTQKATDQLIKVQDHLNKQGYGLKVFDGYRPQMAVDHFVRWARDLNDTLKKTEYYPRVLKQHLFKEGYIASKSGHSRGSTVDLTIIFLSSGKELDMGSSFDFFGPESGIENRNLSEEQKANRTLLKETMNRYGFRSYDKEWWHFTVRDEPFTDQYFDFPIE